VAEALLDLTGAPTEMIYLGDDAFDSELMWARLRAYAQLGLPMGCGTNNAEGASSLRQENRAHFRHRPNQLPTPRLAESGRRPGLPWA